MSFESLLNYTVNIYRKAVTYDSAGSSSESFPDTATVSDVACRIQKVRGDYLTKMRGIDISADYIGFFEYGTDIQEGDKVVWGSKSLYVSNADSDAAAQEHHCEVYLSE